MTPDSRLVGRYQLLKRLAVGGMAEIFLARERGAHDFERLVVIKRILPTLIEDGSFVEMFLQEARITARINHPNVVHIHELGEHEDLPYIVMEYVAGSTLRQLLQEAIARHVVLPVGVVVDLAAQACAGAHAVHELKDPHGQPMGLVHRDLTPHNLMVTDDGFVKVLDFGIVKATEGSDARTRTGVLKGKVGYMSPEQCLQEELDRRSDLFSLANVAWELLAREKVFNAQNEVGVMQAILTGNVRELRLLRDDVPEEIEAVLRRGMALNRDDRYPTADDLRRALLDAAQVAGVPVSRDHTATVVSNLLKERHKQHKVQVEEALEKSLAPFDPASIPAEGSYATTTSTRVGVVGMVSALALGLMAGVGTLTLLALGLWVASTGEDRPKEPPPYVPPEGEPVRIALAPTIDPGLLVAEWEPLRRYLEQAIDRPLQLSVAESYGGAASMLLQGDAEWAVLPPYIFLKTRAADTEHIWPIATKIYDGSSTFEGLLLVHERAAARTVQDLAGVTICYSDVDSTTGYIFPRQTLREAGLDPDEDLKAHVSGNHRQVLRDLLDGTCDVGGTYTGNYTSAPAQDIPIAQLRMLAITGRSPHDTVSAGPSADPEVTERLRQALLSFDPMAHVGRDRLGDAEQISGFERADMDAFEELERAIEAEGRSPR